MPRYAVPQVSPAAPPNRLPSVSRALATAFALSAVLLGARESDADVTIPKSDPSLPTLTEPAQTQSPAVYRERRKELMKEMGEGVAVIYGDGAEDGDGYRPNTDFFYLTGVGEEGAILVLAPRSGPIASFCCCQAAIRRRSAGPANASRSAPRCEASTGSRRSRAPAG